MFGLEIIEVAIGLSLVYLLLASICSMLRERIEAVLNTRAIDLERGIREMLDTPGASKMTAALYANPYVSALFKGEYEAANLKPKTLPGGGKDEVMKRRTTLPAYIPAKNFALALIDVVATPPPGIPPGTPWSMQGAIDSLPAGLKSALTVALAESQGDMDAFRQNIEAWYDSTMERVSSWYKRRTQNVILLLSLGIAGVVNANTLTLVQRLSVDASLRQALVEQAKSDKDSTKRLGDIGLPLGWNYGWPGPPANPMAVDADATSAALSTQAAQPSLSGWPWWRYFVINPIVGLLLTAFAVSLGAPVWFDVMNRLISLRASLKPDESTPTVKPRDSAPPLKPAPPLQSMPLADAAVENAFVPNEWASRADPQEGLL